MEGLTSLEEELRTTFGTLLDKLASLQAVVKAVPEAPEQPQASPPVAAQEKESSADGPGEPRPSVRQTDQANGTQTFTVDPCFRRSDSTNSLGTDSSAALQEPAGLRSYHDQVFSADTMLLRSSPTWLSDPKKTGGAEKKLLRMNPLWMELVTKSGQILEKCTFMDLRSSLSVQKEARSKKSTRNLLGGRKSVSLMQTIWAWRLPALRCPCLHVIHPHSKIKLMWDVAGFSLVLCDSFLMPLSLAWDVQMGEDEACSILLAISFWISLFFWIIDVFVNFNCAFYSQGSLQVRRLEIARHYACSWCLVDITLVAIDIMTAVSTYSSEGMPDSLFRNLRSIRMIRMMRLFRLMKLPMLSQVIEEASVAAGRQWLVLVVAIVKTTFTMLVAAHCLSCGMFFVGRLRSEAGLLSWLDELDAKFIPGYVQYLHCLQWVLTPPAPPPIPSDSGPERLYAVFIVLVTLVVIGSELSKITGTLQELRTINSESSRKRREVRQYLQAQQVPMELIARIMRFVDYKLDRQSSVSLDTTLISLALQIELHVSQRGSFLQLHPVFGIIYEAFPGIFSAICGAVEKHVYGNNEFVFELNSWATSMVITEQGSFSMFSGIGNAEGFHGTRWFAEAALFADSVVHSMSLQATSFGEAFTITGRDLAFCLSTSPMCTAMFCQYAKDLLAELQKMAPYADAGDVQEAEVKCSWTALEQNQFYTALHPDPKTLLSDVEIHIDGSRKDSKDHVSEEDDPQNPNHQSPCRAPHIDGIDSATDWDLAITSHGLDGKVAHEQAVPNIAGFVRDIMQGKLPAAERLAKLQEVILELHPEHGSHALLSLAGERERSESACLSIIALVTDDFKSFTKPQAQPVLLSREQWKQLRHITAWAKPDEEMLQAVLVLLATRSLGKSKKVIQQLPENVQRPEQALLCLMENWGNVVPSVASLSSTALDHIRDALEIHQDFNLAQMLQGENVAASVAILQLHVEKKGQDVFKFYILFLLGFMSGLAGGEGSRFMNAKMAQSTILGVSCLLHVMDSSPAAVYWTYIFRRGEQLVLPNSTAEDLALVRLACLARIQDAKGFKHLHAAWTPLGTRERDMLIKHFVAGGIAERAYVLEFLPLCVANAKQNKFVTVQSLLEVLVDLLRSLESACEELKAADGTLMYVVDLTDFAEFITACQNRFIFQTCIRRCKLRIVDSRAVLQMTGDNWSRTTEAESDTTSLAYSLREVLQQQTVVQELVQAQTIVRGPARRRSTMSSGDHIHQSI
ncbi:unnamed protein product [Polarella glacialis]|uniref:Ion transport domain-containing protein n=1 Tax=Polarella glacialis TaxID=89957 RepID=A0A813DM58_POLGL|nr:unnamed protein product [Polarella glacialis]